MPFVALTSVVAGPVDGPYKRTVPGMSPGTFGAESVPFSQTSWAVPTIVTVHEVELVATGQVDPGLATQDW